MLTKISSVEKVVYRDATGRFKILNYSNNETSEHSKYFQPMASSPGAMPLKLLGFCIIYKALWKPI